MSSFLSSSQLSHLTGVFSRHFSTFGTGINNNFILIKEPIKSINVGINDSNILPGYNNDDFNQVDISYIVNSGQYPCIPIYPSNLNEKQFTELKFSLSDNQVMLKVEESTKNQIIQGKNEYVILNDQHYDIGPDFKIQNYFGLKYYYFKLTSTQ